MNKVQQKTLQQRSHPTVLVRLKFRVEALKSSRDDFNQKQREILLANQFNQQSSTLEIFQIPNEQNSQNHQKNGMKLCTIKTIK